jgi:hypothetical protein
LKKFDGGCGVVLSGTGYRPMVNSCKNGKEHSGSIKYWEYLEWLSNCWLLKKKSAPWSLVL